MSGTRPEHSLPADVYYDARGSRKYAASSRIRRIQRQMAERALELLNLPQAGSDGRAVPCHILDLGCGSGISGRVLAAKGHTWVGVDISSPMLALAKERDAECRPCEKASGGDDDDDGSSDVDDDDSGSDGDDSDARRQRRRRQSPFGQLPLPEEAAAKNEKEEEEEKTRKAKEPAATPAARRTRRMAELVAADMGAGLPFRPGVFDGAISVSALQWLCYAGRRSHVPQRRLRCLFQCLYNSLRRGARAVLQFFPESPAQADMIAHAAMRCGFGGGLVVDYPHSTRARKHYLVLSAGAASSASSASGYAPPLPLESAPLDGDDNDDDDDDDGSGGESGEELGPEGHSGGKRARGGGRPRAGHGHAKRPRRDAAAGTSGGGARPATGSREWVLMKKAERRRFGLQTSDDTKYTMRRRKPQF